MAYNMKNKGKSYEEMFTSSQAKINQAEEDLRSAEDKKENIEEPSPGKYVDKLIDVAVDALKEDTARLERSNNRNVSVMSMKGG